MRLGCGKVFQGSEMHVHWEEDHLDGDLCLDPDTVVVISAVPKSSVPGALPIATDLWLGMAALAHSCVGAATWKQRGSYKGL